MSEIIVMDSFDSFNLFEMLGIEEEKPVAKPVKAEKVGKKPEKKAEKKPEKKISFPLTVLTGVEAPITLTAENAGDANNFEKVVALVTAQKGWPTEITTSKWVSESKLIVTLDRLKAIRKGNFKITETTVVKFGEEQFPAAELGAEVSSEKITEFLSGKLGDETATFSYLQNKDEIYAIIGVSPIMGLVNLPVQVKSPLGDMLLTADDFEEDNLVEGKVDDEDLKEKVLESAQYSEISDILSIYKGAKDGILYVGVGTISSYEKKGTTVPEETYPTNAVVSQLFNRIQLTPEMFGGKEKATTKEIVAILAKDYPEYTPDRTKLTYYKDENLIIPSLKSSTKGMEFFLSKDACMKAAEEKEYFLAEYLQDGKYFRFEKTYVSETAAREDFCGKYEGDGEFRWKLPPIPGRLLSNVRGLFAKVTEEHMTEALAWIMYEPDTGEYSIHIPEQTVDGISVRTEEFSLRGKIRVVDIHSHNRMDAFFSSIDDSDELGNRIYAVMGGFTSDGTSQTLLRAGTGGRYVSINAETVFSDEPQEDMANVEALYTQWRAVTDIITGRSVIWKEARA